jgi:hypothetical protein
MRHRHAHRRRAHGEIDAYAGTHAIAVEGFKRARHNGQRCRDADARLQILPGVEVARISGLQFADRKDRLAFGVMIGRNIQIVSSLSRDLEPAEPRIAIPKR